MKQFLKDIQTKLQDFWPSIVGLIVDFIIIGGFVVFGLYTGGLKSENFIIIITLFILYKVCNFIWSALKKIGFDEIIYKLIRIFQIIIMLFFGIFFLDFIGYCFFKMYLGYNYFSISDYFFKWFNDVVYH